MFVHTGAFGATGDVGVDRDRDCGESEGGDCGEGKGGDIGSKSSAGGSGDFVLIFILIRANFHVRKFVITSITGLSGSSKSKSSSLEFKASGTCSVL